MRFTLVFSAVFLVVLSLTGCGGKQAGETGSPPTPAPAASAPTGDYVVPADLDQGARAGESPADARLAGQGEKLFSAKGCTVCHGFGKRITGPDLNGVAMRRTARWMESQILHPDKMIKQDPTARSLFATYALQMPNQGLTPVEARAVVEYLKKKNQDTK